MQLANNLFRFDHKFLIVIKKIIYDLQKRKRDVIYIYIMADYKFAVIIVSVNESPKD